MLSPVGNSVERSWQAAVAGKSGIGPIEHMDVSEFNTRFGDSLRDFHDEPHMSAKQARKLDLFIQYAIYTCIQALNESGLEISNGSRDRIGVSMGSGIGGLTNLEQNHALLLSSGPRRISPFFVPGSIVNMVAGYLSIQYGLRGPNYALTTACTTGTHSIGMAARNI